VLSYCALGDIFCWACNLIGILRGRSWGLLLYRLAILLKMSMGEDGEVPDDADLLAGLSKLAHGLAGSDACLLRQER